MSLQDIYQEVLLAHNENPNNFRVLDNPSHSAHGSNPLCGDELNVYVNVHEGIVKELAFSGQGCAICKASASLMTQSLEGKTTEQAIKEAKDFIALLNDKNQTAPKNLGEREALLGVRKFPARLKCATLAWHTFLKAMHANANCQCNSNNKNCCGCCCH